MVKYDKTKTRIKYNIEIKFLVGTYKGNHGCDLIINKIVKNKIIIYNLK